MSENIILELITKTFTESGSSFILLAIVLYWLYKFWNKWLDQMKNNDKETVGAMKEIALSMREWFKDVILSLKDSSNYHENHDKTLADIKSDISEIKSKIK